MTKPKAISDRDMIATLTAALSDETHVAIAAIEAAEKRRAESHAALLAAIAAATAKADAEHASRVRAATEARDTARAGLEDAQKAEGSARADFEIASEVGFIAAHGVGKRNELEQTWAKAKVAIPEAQRIAEEAEQALWDARTADCEDFSLSHLEIDLYRGAGDAVTVALESLRASTRDGIARARAEQEARRLELQRTRDDEAARVRAIKDAEDEKARRSIRHTIRHDEQQRASSRAATILKELSGLVGPFTNEQASQRWSELEKHQFTKLQTELAEILTRCAPHAVEGFRAKFPALVPSNIVAVEPWERPDFAERYPGLRVSLAPSSAQVAP